MDISRLLDKDQKIKVWPSKKDKKLEILKYLATKFECGRDYTEKEVNQIIDRWHAFGDYFLLRRELIDNRLMFRTRDGSRYWKEEPPADADGPSL